MSGISTSSPVLRNANETSEIAASPLGTSRHSVPPSSVARRSSSVKVVGVPCRP
ncbi:hypothetical protein D9M68_625260 [compost metagenome]